MVFRQSVPVLGAQKSPYLEPGEWLFTFGYRGLNSHQHFRGTEKVTDIRSGVVNSQHIFTLQLARAVAKQWEVGIDIPIVWNGFSLLRPVPGGGGERARQAVRARGLGDISLQGRYWILDCPSHPHGNVALELGLKLPTGRSDVRDDVFGQLVPVDQSIQPGDSGVGFSTGLQAFKTLGDFTLFLSGTYLFNPKNTSGTPTFFGSFRGDTTFLNSVQDQYVGRLGVGMAIRQVPGLSLTFAGRVEGVPVHDVFGKSEGFRRPGHTVFVEPGLVYSKGRNTWAISVPVRVYTHVMDSDTTVRIEDATVASHMVLFSYSRKFGK